MYLVFFWVGFEFKFLYLGFYVLSFFVWFSLLWFIFFFVDLLWWIVDWFEGLGIDRGVMIVMVVGVNKFGVSVEWCWILIVEVGDGFNIFVFFVVFLIWKFIVGDFWFGVCLCLGEFFLVEVEVVFFWFSVVIYF